MTRHIWTASCASLALLVAIAGCETGLPDKALEKDPDRQLALVLEQIRAVDDAGSQCYEVGYAPTTDCERLLSRLEMLAVLYPRHVPILLANAQIAHATGQPEKALSYLSLLFALEPAHAEAAVLRGQISIEQGNLPFARRFLSEQVEIHPDHAELRETLAAAYFLSGDLDRARKSLERAERLGAPAWRIAYHLGLLAETGGARQEAIARYREALEGNPEFAPAQARLRGLEVGR